MSFKEHYQKKEVVNSYDALRTRGLKARVIRRLESRFVDMLVKDKKKQKILEIGTGTGFISKLLIDKGNFYGFDSSKGMLEKTKKALYPKKANKLVEGDILNIRLKEKFDYVVTIRVISHFDKNLAVESLKSISKVLENKGMIVFNLENKSLFRRTMRLITRWGSTKTYQYSYVDILNIIGESGLELDEIFYLDHLFFLPLHFLNKLFFNKLEGFIFNLELKLKKFAFMANNSFIRCKKPSF